MNRFESMSRRQQALSIGAFGFAVLVVLFLLAEGAVRIRQWIKYDSLNFKIEELYRTDPETGLRVPVKGFSKSRININSAGFRGPEIEKQKPAGTIRIAFLGASTTFSAEVSSDEATWPHLVVEAIKKRWPNRRFDYINAAVPGYGVETSLRSLQLRVEPFEPDVIIINHANNDLSGNSFRLALESGAVESRINDTLSWPSEYSLLWYLVEKNLMIMRVAARSGAGANTLKVDVGRLTEPFRRDLTELVEAANGVARVVALSTYPIHLRAWQNDRQRRKAIETSIYYMPYMTADTLLESFAAYNEVIREVAEQQDVILIGDEDSIPGDPVNFADSIHLTDAGSRPMAKRVLEGLINGGFASAFNL